MPHLFKAAVYGVRNVALLFCQIGCTTDKSTIFCMKDIYNFVFIHCSGCKMFSPSQSSMILPEKTTSEHEKT